MKETMLAIGKKLIYILKIVVEIYAACYKEINQLITLILCVWSAYNIISRPGSSVGLVICLHIVMFPILRLVIGVLSIIPVTMCKILVALIHEKEDESYHWGYGKEDHNKQGRADGRQSGEWDDFFKSYQKEAGSRRSSNQSNQSGQSNQHRQSSSKQEQKTWQDSRSSELQEALWYYGLTMPYTQEKLREKRKILMKKAHPDSGGTNEDAKKINMYYDVLKQYAS